MFRKHQRTQGHIQASELFEKKRAEGLVGDMEPLLHKEEMLEGSETRSEDSSPLVGSSSSSVNEDESAHGMDISKSSPKRKQMHPMKMEDGEMEEEEEEYEQLSPREESIRSNIEYNTMSHTYDCRQCVFSSVDHAATREHVTQDHLRESAELQCKECLITFTKPFNLQIHNRKHETNSQFLPCDYCEQVFKVPNKLIKHMEGVHCVCPSCGVRCEDKSSLVNHMEQVHNEVRRGIHINIQHLSNLSALLPVKHRFDIDSRHAKMRKLDTLTEHIRAKQLLNSNGNHFMNGNEKPLPPPSEPVFRKKNDLNLLREKEDLAVYTSRTGLDSLVTQLNRVHSPLVKSENNNILSSLSKMSTDPRLYHQHRQQPELPPQHDELTPPCSPPPSDARITSNVILINNNPTCESEDSNEVGLDLTLKKERREEREDIEEREARDDRDDRDGRADSAERHPEERSEEYFRGRIITPSFPYIVPSLPFLRMPLAPVQPQNNSFTEHLFKLASISRPPSSNTPQDLSKPAVHVNPPPPPPGHNVISAMLAHRPPVPTSVFPVFGGPIPASMFPQHPLPPRTDESNGSISSLGRQHISSSQPGFNASVFSISASKRKSVH